MKNNKEIFFGIATGMLWILILTYAWRQAYLASEWKRLYHTSSSQIEAIAKWKHEQHKEKLNEISPQTNP